MLQLTFAFGFVVEALLALHEGELATERKLRSRAALKRNEIKMRI